MTVVLPEPVAILAAMRKRPGLAVSFASTILSWKDFGATSVSQMIVSTASIWQKKNGRSRTLRSRHQRRSRSVSAVTPHCEGGSRRQASTCGRIDVTSVLSLVSSVS